MRRKIIALCVVLLVPVLTVVSAPADAEPGASINSIRLASASLNVGYGHACALNTEGAAYCWGSNTNGQLGNGTKAASYTAVPVANGKNFIAISAASFSTCALSVYETVWCWGSSLWGNLGNGTTTSSTIPVQVRGITTATAITVAETSACALLENQTVWCWGDNDKGQLGNGTTTSSTIPVQVSGITTATAISGSKNQFCTLLANSTIKCWGYGEYAELGNNTRSSSVLPVSVFNLSGAVGVASNYGNGCALFASGTISCWGSNQDYVIGHNRNGGLSLVPETNLFVSSAQSIALGTTHACVLINDGSVKCWGSNFFGELGNGANSSSDFYIPEVVAGLSGVKALDSDSYSTCASLSDGSVKCWGSNYGGKLGNGENADSPQPVTVIGISGLVGASTASTTTTTTTTTVPKTTTTTTTTVPKTTTTTTTTTVLQTTTTTTPSSSASSNLNGRKCTKSGSIKKTTSGKFACVKIGGTLKWKLLR